jgi:hypothetical protein
MLRFATFTLATTMVLTACGGDDTTSGSGGSGGVGGASAGGAGGSGGGQAEGCLAMWTDAVIAPDADGPDTQIHGSGAFDGDKIWMAWSRPDDMSLFDIYLAAFSCDGSVAVAPFEITQADDNELNPILSVSGDRLMVAWTSDNSTGVDNLDIRYRLFDLEGAPMGNVVELAANRQGVPVTGNALNPDLAATADGWILGGIWGHQDAPAFQGFVVALDQDGAVQGEAEDLALDTAATQTHVAVAAEGSAVHLAWQEETAMSTAPSTWSRTQGAAVMPLADPGGRPDVGAGPWYAWDGDGSDITVRPPTGADVQLGLSGFVHDVSLAVADGQAAVAWMEIVSGINNRLHVARLDASGSLGPIHDVATDSAPSVYPVDLTMVDATHGVLVYQDGAAPDFRLKADFFTLE